RWRAGAAVTPGAFGVPEPGEDCDTVEPELLLVPLLAFDRAGRRLGYGQGHFDRTLAGLRARRPTVAVGIAFAAQEVACVPTDPQDQLLGGVVTEAVYIAPRKDIGCVSPSSGTWSAARAATASATPCPPCAASSAWSSSSSTPRTPATASASPRTPR